MKNKLSDLNNHLFAQLERLSEENLKGSKLSEEIIRAKAVTDVAKNIIENGKLILDATVAQKEWSIHGYELAPILPENSNGNGKSHTLYSRNAAIS